MEKTILNKEKRSHVFTIDRIRHENEMTSSLIMKESLEGEPGQFLLLWLPGVGEKPFSIAGTDPLVVTVADVGKLTHEIHTLQPGDRVWIRGPFGQGYQAYGTDALLVGGGYGASPLLFLAETLIEKGTRVQVFLGARTKDLLILKDQFEELPLKIYITTNDGSCGIQGFVTVPLEESIRNLPDPQDACVYACGPKGMLIGIDALCEKYNIARQLSWEAIMRCGMGLCGNCKIEMPDTWDEPSDKPGSKKAWLVCRDGPTSFTK
ncbi:MAG TPA: hypothetical protein PLQ28_06380 [Flexilinea sp.]|nr:hypothetical protein [Flexilinea sp.]HOW07441.1 hypothetical protein [Flexilinea sp.]